MRHPRAADAPRVPTARPSASAGRTARCGGGGAPGSAPGAGGQLALLAMLWLVLRMSLDRHSAGLLAWGLRQVAAPGAASHRVGASTGRRLRPRSAVAASAKQRKGGFDSEARPARLKPKMGFSSKDHDRQLTEEEKREEIRASRAAARYFSEAEKALDMKGSEASLEERRKLYSKARVAKSRSCGKDGSDYARLCGNLGNVYMELNEHARAIKLFLEAKAILTKVTREVGDESSLDMAGYALNLARLYRSSGSTDEAAAERELTQALQIYASNLVTHHEKYRQCLRSLATLYQETGRGHKVHHLLKEERRVQLQLGARSP